MSDRNSPASHSKAKKGAYQSPLLYPALKDHNRIVDALSIHFGSLDEKGFFRYWSSYSKKMFGYSQDEVIGKCGLELIVVSRNMARKIKAVAVRNGVYEDEIQLRRRDGTFFPAYLVLIPLFTEEKKVAGYYQFARDISRKKEKELEQKKREEELQELNIALKVLLKKREEGEKAYEERFMGMLKQLIMPQMKNLQTISSDPKALAIISTIISDIEDFTLRFSASPDSREVNLTPRELGIPRFIKSGKNSKEIAHILGISPETVQFHRKNIRKKLDIQRKKVNLSTRLNSL